MPRYQVSLLVLLLGLLAISCVGAPYPHELVLQHVLTLAALPVLVVCHSRLGLGKTSFTLLCVFLALHILGARYSYSDVPYDAWLDALFGFRPSQRFGFRRNHYDRFAHFAFGCLFAYPAWEAFARRLRLGGGLPYVLAAQCVMTSSMLYEVLEWGVALAFAPGMAEAYNGQQGDVWDAQKDMALAASGAVFGLAVIAVLRGARVTRD